MSQSLRRAIVAASLMALTLPASAFAVTGSASVSETLVVTQAAAITITGLPTSVNLGAALPGSTTPDTTIGTATVNLLGGVLQFSLGISQTDLMSGGNVVQATQSQWSFNRNGAGYTGFVAYPIAGTILDDSTPGAPPYTVGIKTHWNIPAGAVAGTYTGTLTVSALGS